MKIPVTFQLVNTTWTVKPMSTEVAEMGDRHGDCSRALTTIRLHVSPENSLEDTYSHELAHAMLEFTTKPKLSKNESFVQSLGEVLCQYLNTAKGNFKPE